MLGASEMSCGPQPGRRRPKHGLPWTLLLSVELGLGDMGLFHPAAPSPSLPLGWEWCVSSIPAGTLYRSIPADQGCFSSSPPAAQEG